MKIRAGSKNKAKLLAIRTGFPEADVEGHSVPSNVSAQPITDEETLQGAINRATQCADNTSGTYGIGLEGGVMELGGHLYVCNWGALVTPSGDLYTASGARIKLPKGFKSLLDGQEELGHLMDVYTKKEDIRQNEGAIGIFTNQLMTRSDMFAHVVILLRGQLEYNSKF
ncbi:DUF84 family protein [Lentibacillus saliphilus]|uniref:DUF84 family protein n=1 Tax=Lentibacillus saliphilus TaxID=2737028 RepID=UPI001C2FE6A4|nr:DUF84 family protein [Lentibacillus saliphilus]